MRLLPVLLLLLPVSALAQTEFGIKAGLNISDIVMTNYINPDVESELDLKPGLHAGVFVYGMVNDRVGIAAELLYSDKGVKAPHNIHLHYITVPLMATYKLTDNIFAEIGPELGYLFSATSPFGNESTTYNNKLDLSLDAGFRFDTPKLIFGIRYCAGVFSVREPFETYSAAGTEKVKYQNRVLQLSVGYKLWVLK